MSNNLIDIKKILTCKKDKEYLERGGSLYMTIKHEDGTTEKFRIKLKGKNKDNLKG